jgi:alpha-tubulin suppressor-like RCC1 family protein
MRQSATDHGHSGGRRDRRRWLTGRPRRAARALTVAGALSAGLLAVAAAVPAAGAAAVAPPTWIHVAAGWESTCGIREGNTLWCWGQQIHGDLGTGRPGNANQPQQITRKTSAWTSVTVGDNHACATRKDGGLWCWGFNGYGQLGIGTTTDSPRPQQVTTPAADGWASVSAGVDHTCALRTDGTLWCWGRGDLGAVGNGSTTDQDLPQQVTTPAADGWTSVTANGPNSCATRADSSLWCWGFNLTGELGIGSTTNQDRPQQVTTPAADGWTSVISGASTCATRSDSSLWCWGWNGNGQLGIGSTTDQHLPQQVTIPAATGWTTVSAGSQHVCATRTHALWCWGDNQFGELGIGITTELHVPQRVTWPTAAGWTLITAGDHHTCATRTGHALYCWGDNFYGELGIGGGGQQTIPQPVARRGAAV